jgi:hypothetical protein
MVFLVDLVIRDCVDNGACMIEDRASQRWVGRDLFLAVALSAGQSSKIRGAPLPCGSRTDMVLTSKWNTAYCESNIAGPNR